MGLDLIKCLYCKTPELECRHNYCTLCKKIHHIHVLPYGWRFCCMKQYPSTDFHCCFGRKIKKNTARQKLRRKLS